ncbi:dolichol kinase, putative [Candida dubliniensis CD36]|uniref:dolichol kinase n=1 Tax=Candida dubliniensis (strain CD36 / ATCC MYA-646 / CBS 7987 / NCPF 3949 / NRRL Y-17841) TaxID=573826 RepID=B9WDN3_CANDC|nr:dolichol kinase, putative [Candida dubliniensis CD36]CAX42789.1 dolichol kinase, putative [Candida dubliniensis CD36]
MAGGRKRKNEVKKPNPIARSTAAIFQDINNLDELEPNPQPKTEIEINQESNDEPTGNPEDDIANASFPFNYLYRVQDHLNENMSVVHGVQCLVCLFFIQMVYLDRVKIINYSKDEHLPMQIIAVIFFNWVGVFLCTVLGIVKNKNKNKNEGNKMITDFNYIYSLLLPALLNILHFNKDWLLVNLSLNYFIIDSMNPIFNLFSCLGFYEVYKDEETTLISTFQFGQYATIFLVFQYILNYINTEEIDDEDNNIIKSRITLKKSEIHLIILLLINILFNPAFTNGDVLPMKIFQKLIISFIISSFFTFPIVSFTPGILIILIFGGIFYGFTIFQLTPILNDNALNWLYNYVIKDETRIYILSIWVIMSMTIIPIVFYFANYLKLNTRRKIWHGLMVIALCFTSEILFDQIEFTLISLLGTLIVFMVVESVRYNRISYIGEFLHKTLTVFQDAKDLQGPLNLSYIYLLVGVTIPIVYDYLINKDTVTIIRYSGLITLGIGDTFASVIGKRFGTFKWKGSNKSIQGTIAFIVSVFLCIYGVDYYLTHNNTNYHPIKNWENAFVTILLAGFLEGTCDINDNYLIPIFFPISYQLLNKSYK